jgi:hypothetical protein
VFKNVLYVCPDVKFALITLSAFNVSQQIYQQKIMIAKNAQIKVGSQEEYALLFLAAQEPS